MKPAHTPAAAARRAFDTAFAPDITFVLDAHGQIRSRSPHTVLGWQIARAVRGAAHIDRACALAGPIAARFGGATIETILDPL